MAADPAGTDLSDSTLGIGEKTYMWVVYADRNGFIHQRYVQKLPAYKYELGAGSYAKVFLANDVDDGDKEVAVKFGNPDRNFNAIFKREAHILQKLKHSNVIGFFDITRCQNPYWLHKSHGPPMLVMEYAEKGDLKTLLKKSDGQGLSELAVGSFFGQLVKGINYMHGQGIVHRDLKPANLLLTLPPKYKATEGHEEEMLFLTVKIGDFGCAEELPPFCCSSPKKSKKKKSLSREKRMWRLKSACGTLWYMPPEACRHYHPDKLFASTDTLEADERNWRKFGCPSDVFVLGLILFELWTGKIAGEILGGFRRNFCFGDIETLDKVFQEVLRKKTEGSINNIRRLLRDLLNPSHVTRVTVSNVRKRAWMNWISASLKLRKTEILKALEKDLEESNQQDLGVSADKCSSTSGDSVVLAQ